MSSQTAEQQFAEETALEQYTKQIKLKEQFIQDGFLYLGRLLLEVRGSKVYKAKYETFKQYVEDNFTFTVRNAQRFMQMYDLFKNCEIDVAKLGIGKLIELLKLPESERDDFVKANEEFLENSSVKEIKEKVSKETSKSPYEPYYKRINSFYKGTVKLKEAITGQEFDKIDKDTKRMFRSVIGQIEIELEEIKKVFQ